MSSQGITYGVQSGDRSSAEATVPLLKELRALLSKYTARSYCDAFPEFAIVLRVSGSISSFEGEGCQKLRISRKGRYVTIDIVMPRSRWEGVAPQEIKDFLATMTREALGLIVNRIRKLKLEVDSERLEKDLDQVLSEFGAA